MRVAICCPLDRHSAIARATLYFAEHLAAVASVTIFAEPTDDPLDCPFPMRPLASVPFSTLDDYDRVIVVLGNSGYHLRSLLVARQRRCIVILHDTMIAHLVGGVLSPQELETEVTAWYGEASGAEFLRIWRTDNRLRSGVLRRLAGFPLTELALGNAQGVVVHSPWAAGQIGGRTIAPVAVIPLAHRATHQAEAAEIVHDVQPTLLTLGHANANKCHELVIAALARMARPGVVYCIAGPVSPERRAELMALATQLGVADAMKITGSLPGGDVARLVESATICVNLRMPAFEGASATLIEQMASGKPVVVYDHGCYSDPPDDSVVRIPTTATVDDLAGVLAQLLDDGERRALIGARAKAHIELGHRPDAYAHRLVEFFAEVDAHAPRLDLAHAVRDAVTPWGPLPAAWRGAWAKEMSALTGR